MPCSEPVFLALGSNIPYKGTGSREILLQAAEDLSREISQSVLSSLYLTRAMYVTDQNDFYNAVLTGFYPASPENLLDFVQNVEKKFGRDRLRERRYGERTLDIDILLFGARYVDSPPRLMIPHPKMKERRFVLEPLVEICPDAQEPSTCLFYRELLPALADQTVQKISANPLS